LRIKVRLRVTDASSVDSKHPLSSLSAPTQGAAASAAMPVPLLVCPGLVKMRWLRKKLC